MAKQLIQPKWLTLAGAETYTGLSGRTVERRIADGTLVATYARAKGNQRGRLLISRESIDMWLDAGIGESPEMAAGMNGTEAAVAREGER